ncbi:MAG TPA: zf-HC2 domain-containing protein [candidate division Zixibacteria bacterium]|nr:zf-HC2 domain-containing protein [candidate division Zixibacteria bacterium]
MIRRPRPGDEHPQELLSASLTGDLTDEERASLDRHLAGCQACTRALAEFRRGRELLGGMRHVAPPRDLAARVYAAVDAPPMPWWRRPGTLVAGLATGATMAAAVLAVLTFGNLRPGPVGEASPLPTATVASPVPVASVTPDVISSPTETPMPTPLQVAVMLRAKVEDQKPTVTIVTPRGSKELLNRAAVPVAAAVSPDGSWLAFRAENGDGSLIDVFATRGDEILHLGESTATSGIGDELAWSPNGRYLAYTMTSPQRGTTDAWVFDAETGNVLQLTNSGDAFASSWMPSESGEQQLWVSRASATPVSYLLEIPSDSPPAEPVDPAAVAVQTVDGVFGPLVAPDGTKVIFWTGSLANLDGRWVFQPGMPMLDESADGRTLDFDGRPLFSTLVPTGGEAFTSAEIVWGPDSNAFAVWNAEWTAIQQPEGFPDRNRVYFGHVDVPELITPRQALDVADLAGVDRVVHVVIAPDGMTLAVTVQTAPGSEEGAFGPEAEIRIIERGLGDEPDRVTTPRRERDTWWGPAVFEDWDG